MGANLVRMLLDQGHSVRVLDNLSTGRPEHLDDLDMEIVEGDILSRDQIRRAISGIDGVVHLAAQTGVQESIQDPHKDCQVNVIGTLNLLEASKNAGVKRFVFASSNAPIGRQKPPANEDKTPLPISPYGASKAACEGYCLAYQGSWGLGTVALRFSNLYGPYSGHKKSVVAKFFKDLLTHGRITIDGDGGQTRDFIFVDDLSRAVVLALESGVSGEIFQVATGIETTIRELSSLVGELVPGEIEVTYGPTRQGDIRRNYSDISKARQQLRWNPEVELVEGLRKTHRWFEIALGADGEKKA